MKPRHEWKWTELYLFKRVRINPEGHWIWMWGFKEGYPKVTLSGESQSAKRVAYKYFIGPIPNDVFVIKNRPEFNCPIECINPDHLYAHKKQ